MNTINIISSAEEKMKKAVESLKNEFTKIRTGRAHTSILENVLVDYYGTMTPLSRISTITAGDSRTLLVTPWEKQFIKAIEKAILESGLGFNPVSDSGNVRIPIPPLTEDKRKELIKFVSQQAEHGRVSIRNIRHEANNALKKLTTDKTISEDDEKRAKDQTQKLTDKYIESINKLCTEKETDLKTV